MLEVHFANELSSLSRELAFSLRFAPPTVRDFFAPAPLVLVPDPPMASFLKLEIAKYNGVFADIRLFTVGQWLQSALPQRLPDGRQPRLLRREPMQLALMAILSQLEELDAPELAPLRAFFVPHEDAALHALRVFQIAQQSAKAFDLYHLERPQLIDAWLQHSLCFSDDPAVTAIERWQRALYLLMLEKMQGTQRWLRIDDVVRKHDLMRLLERSEGFGSLQGAERRIHVFGFLHLPAALRQTFAHLSAKCDLVVWSFNPCMEYWEDVRGRGASALRTQPQSSAGERAEGQATQASQSPSVEPEASAETLADAQDDGVEKMELQPSLFTHRPWLLPSDEATEELASSVFDESPRLFEETENPEPSAELEYESELAWQSFAVDDDGLGDNLALQVWGRAGREHTRWLNERCARERNSYSDPLDSQQTMLAQLQHHILLRIEVQALEDTPSSQGEHAGIDPSVRILCCPSQQREVELVADHILDAVWQTRPGSEPIRFSDIAIFVPSEQRQLYMNRIFACFGEHYGIPCHFIDAKASAWSRIYSAVETLLELPGSNFPRDRMLALFNHPHFQSRFPETDPALWIRWCDELGIVHGADRDDHAHTYINFDIFNWEQGIKRLCLGCFMATEDCDTALIPLAGEQYAPFSTPTEQRESVARFALLIRSLVADARFAAQSKLTAAQWSAFLTAFVNTYLCAQSDDDQRALEHIIESFDSLAEVDARSTHVRSLSGTDLSTAAIPSECREDACPSLTAGRLDFALVRHFILDRLRAATQRRGQFLADGVMVAPLASNRVYPFKMVVLMGLDESAFPRNDAPGALDLRAASTLPGELSSRDQDLYLLLALLMNTRERLLLSYVDRDELTGDPIAPSVVVDELRLMIERGYPAHAAAVLEKHPQHRFDPRYFPELSASTGLPIRERSQQARDEARALLVRKQLEAQLTIPSHGVELLERLTPEAREAVQKLLSVSLPPDRPEAPPLRRIDMNLQAVKRFLENPIAYYVFEGLGLRHEESSDERLERVDEVFESDDSLSFALCVDVLLEAFVHKRNINKVYDQRIARLLRRGVYPIGPFGHAQRARDLDRMVAWRSRMQSMRLEVGSPIRRIVLGRPGQWPPPSLLGRAREELDEAQTHPALRFHIPVHPQSDESSENAQPKAGEHDANGTACLEVTLHARSSPLLDAKHPLVFLDERKLSAERLLGSQLELLLCRAAGIEVAENSRSYLINAGEGAGVAPLAPLTATAAYNYFERILEEMLTAPHLYLLPIGAVAAALRKRGAGPDELDRQLAAPKHRRSLQHLPLRELLSIQPPPQPAAMVQRRFGPFLQALSKFYVESS
ncbi:MAG: exodeoxyribonuclease V subunit gamma [Myxococcota bacterium]|jgi:exodeoxyribonuclease V gamma subunit|nr:exodeoxyribonuclease V subunit gamma [Myxococcota bacterium]